MKSNRALIYLCCCFLIAGCQPGFAQDKTFKGYRFFINPGHGGHDSDDRHILATDFWESEGNLEKAKNLQQLLTDEKATVFLSRTTNTSADDLDFVVIDEMANAANVDFFLSIHSNGGSGQLNRPLTLYRGYDSQPVFRGAKEMASILWQNLYANNTGWTHSEPYVKGDFTFYPEWGKQGLGVMRNLAVPGVLTEGSFHDYLPESWRMKNKDYLRYEAWALFRSFKDFYGITRPNNGIIAGVVRDSLKKSVWKTAKNSVDANAPMDNVRVTLLPDNRVYQIDNQSNGFFYFEDVEPGDYSVLIEAPDGIRKDTVSVVVKENRITRLDVKLSVPK